MTTLIFAESAVWTNPADGKKLPIGEIPAFVDGDVICFVGDSITRWPEAYHRYISGFWMTRHPEKKLRFINAGINGHSAAYVLNRFEYDVKDWKPTYITLMLGMNDVGWQHYEPNVTPEKREEGRQAAAARWKKDYDEVLNRMQQLQPRAIIAISPTVYDEYAQKEGNPPRKGTDADLARLGEIAHELATARKLPFLDWRTPLFTILRQKQAEDPKFTLIPDSSHPTAIAHMILAYAFLQAQGETGLQSVIAIDANARTIATKTACSVSDLKVETGRVSFSYTSEALPYFLEDGVKSAQQYLGGFTDFAGRQFLRVLSLAEGEWQVSIDGTDMGVFKHDQLRTGIDLASFPKAPDVLQAREVMALNGKRLSREAETARIYVEYKERLYALRHEAIGKKEPLPEDEAEAYKALAERATDTKTKELYLRVVDLISAEGQARWRAKLREMTDACYQAAQPKIRVVTITKSK